MKNITSKLIQLTALTIACAMFVNLSSEAVVRAAQASSKQKISSVSVANKATTRKSSSSSSEYKAFWYSFYDYSAYRASYKKRNATTFKKYFTGVVNKGKSLGMNRIIVQVRPFGDAIYKSHYFPWSKYISGKQGRSPGYDPLKIMVSVAHSKGLAIEAWVNPYRVTTGSVKYRKLSKKNPARKWHAKSSTKRNVLKYNGSLYYNPSKPAVRKLINNGVKEIVDNYDVDGIHMDDYFYPAFSKKNVKKAFDGKEFKKSKYKSIRNYRRAQVNKLVKELHSTVKKADSNATFGISPAGNISNLTSKYSYYVDIYRWLKSTKYVDYICPQIYWGFKHPTAKFSSVTKRWVKAAKSGKVDLYVGIAVYRAGHKVGASRKEKNEWKKDQNILKKQVKYARSKGAEGFAFFDYQDLKSKASRKAVKKLKTVL